MDWADDITYAVHDLEDFIRSGRVPIVSLATDPVELAEFLARATERLAKKHKDIDWGKVSVNFGDVLTAMFAQFQKHEGTAEHLAKLRSVSRKLIDNYVSAIFLDPGDEPLGVPKGLRGEVELFKQLTWHYVIHDPALASMQLGQARLVNKLFDELFEWLQDAEATRTEYRLPKRLWDLYVRTASEPGHETYVGKAARQARSVADYIASLTETQTVDLYERLRGSGVHSVTDPWLRY
jgi:dGTPase